MIDDVSASLRDRACAPDGAEPPTASQAKPLVPSADDFERWGLLTRNPAPDAARGANYAATVRIIITADGRVLPRSQCDHSGWEFAKHGRCCPACDVFVVDFGD